MITNLVPGDGYDLKSPLGKPISIQIGMGGDCGVFFGNASEKTFECPPLFRVLVNQKDLRRNWRKSGHFELNDLMKKYAIYGDLDIGDDARYKVSLECVDHRVPISEEEFRKLEQLSVWETIHVLKRFGELGIADVL